MHGVSLMLISRSYLLMLPDMLHFSLLHFLHLSRLLIRSVELGVHIVLGHLTNSLQLENHFSEFVNIQVVFPHTLYLPDLPLGFQKFLLSVFIFCRRCLQAFDLFEEFSKPTRELIVLLLAPSSLSSERELVATMTLQCIEIFLTFSVIFMCLYKPLSDVDKRITCFSYHTSIFLFALVDVISATFICYVTSIAATEFIILLF